MNTKSYDRYKNALFFVGVLLSFAAILLLTALLSFALHIQKITEGKAIIFIVFGLIWLAVTTVVGIKAIRIGDEYREDSHNISLDIIQNLSGNYNAIFLLDLENDVVRPLRVFDDFGDFDLDSIKNPIDFRKFIGRYNQEVVLEDYRSEFIEQLDFENIQRTLTDRKYSTFIYKRRNDGRENYCQIKVVKPEDLSNQYVLGFADVDAEIRADEEKKRILKEALNNAENANKVKTTFLRNMSHDIRTPLNAIMGFATVAQWELNEPEKMGEYITKIISASNQMLYLVNNVLDMSMMEGGKMKLSPIPANLRSIIQDVEIVTRSLALDRHQKFDIDTSGIKHDSVMCDAVALNRILMNVLGNASSYTPDGGKIKFVSKEIVSKDSKATYSFEISDNGIGMSEDYLEHIYEMFSRERTTTESGIPGVGLGMSITKVIVDAMKGKINIDSVKNEGTKVTITLTFDYSAQKVDFEKIEDSDRCETESPNKKRVLIAEDNEMNREILANMLESFDCIVDQAINGREVVDMFAKSQPGYYKMIFMDIRMPVLDGYGATEEIRKMNREDAESIPIIAITSNAFSKDVADARQHGLSEHLSKPIKAERIKEVLERLS